MRLTRREFLEISAGAVALAGIGLTGLRIARGNIYFNDFRALPGMHLVLKLNVPKPEKSRVYLAARAEGREGVLASMTGASDLEIEVPMIETDEEIYELYAVVETESGRLKSECVEVLAQPYMFGL